MRARSAGGQTGARSSVIVTPWGDSDSLRERRLRPGPGTSPEEVARNQRERLYGATVAAVSNLGYEATRVADLVEISGVSSRSFYALFPNKEACFIATLKALVEGTAAALLSAGGGDLDWDERVRQTFDAFAALVAAQPATARFVITDAYAAGPVAWETLDRSMGQIEKMARTRFAESDERATMPADLICAQIGAIQEITRTRLREGGPEDLAATLPELMRLLHSYRPPPEPLRLATRAPSFGPETTDAHDDAGRALRAFALVVAERGYAGLTINEVAKRGAMSPGTFYANFRDKEDALLAAIDSVMAEMTTAAATAFARSPDWASGIRAATGNMLNFLASRPAMAHLLAVDIFAGGDEAMRRRALGARQLEAIFADGLRLGEAVPPVAVEAVSGGIAALIRRRILDSGTASLPGLAPVCTYFALAPILGPAEACAAANGDGRGRDRQADPSGAILRPLPTKWSVVTMVSRRPVTAEAVAEALELDLDQVERFLVELEADRMVQRIEPTGPGAPVEWAGSKTFRLIDHDEWAAMTPAERDEAVAVVVDGMRYDIDVAREAGTINSRLDSHNIRFRMMLDERGWGELSELHRSVLHASQLILVESERRLRRSGEQPIYASSHQMLFEVPEPSD
jgi:AcrR family transcriptional regulator